jgi:hypothetical protein
VAETRLVEEVTTSLEMDAAFGYVADFHHQAEWDPNTVTSRRVGEPPVAVGSRFALVVKMGRGTVPMEYRITELVPPRRVVLVGEGDRIWTEDTIELREDAGMTVVSYAARIRLSGLLGLIQPLLGGQFRAIGQGAATGLKRELDRLANERT